MMKSENIIRPRAYCYWLVRYALGDKEKIATTLLVNIMKDNNPLAWNILELVLPEKEALTYAHFEKAADKVLEIYREEEARRKAAA